MFPIKTEKQGQTIRKEVVEDVYKISNRMYEALEKAYENCSEYIDSVHKEYEDGEGELIIGIGTATPSGGDKFDEETGSKIAFKKAKLNANIKKLRWIKKVLKESTKFHEVIYSEVIDMYQQIYKDISDLREYDPNFNRKF